MRPFRRAGTWVGVLALIPILMFVDSERAGARFAYAQWLANLMMFASFWWIWRDAPPRLKRLMMAGLLMGTAGELFFSLVLGMYEYRLENVPLYVPPGHSVLYAAVFYFVREPWVMRNQRWLSPVLLGTGLSFAAYWLIAHNDVFGAACTALYVYLIWKHKESRLFFLSMFLLVAYLELFGTGFGCWYWPATAFDQFSFLPSGNPPSGISIFYFGFDAGCLTIYGYTHRHIAKRHERIMACRAEQRGKAGPRAAAAAVPAE
jgi:hypothetical protein